MDEGDGAIEEGGEDDEGKRREKKQTKRDETVSRISKIHSTFISHFASLLNFHLSSSLPLSR